MMQDLDEDVLTGALHSSDLPPARPVDQITERGGAFIRRRRVRRTAGAAAGVVGVVAASALILPPLFDGNDPQTPVGSDTEPTNTSSTDGLTSVDVNTDVTGDEDLDALIQQLQELIDRLQEQSDAAGRDSDADSGSGSGSGSENCGTLEEFNEHMSDEGLTFNLQPGDLAEDGTFCWGLPGD